MPVDPKRVQAVFLAAVENPEPAGRSALLDRECHGDAELRQRVETLLRVYDEPGGSFLEQPADRQMTGAYIPQLGENDIPAGAVEKSGEQIGPYKLFQLLGEGGMGSVWAAEQKKPVQRVVAVKVVRAGMSSAPVIARFEAERQTGGVRCPVRFIPHSKRKTKKQSQHKSITGFSDTVDVE